MGLSNAVVVVLPLDERTEDNQGYRILGQAGSDAAVGMAPIAAMPASAEPFRIGAMDALTGVGESYGNPIVQAKQMAVEEINAAGGINGRMLELIAEDSKCNAQDAITAYNKLTDVDGVKIILGTTCSGAMLGAAPLAEADGRHHALRLRDQPGHQAAGDYIFRTAINDDQLGIDTGNTMCTPTDTTTWPPSPSPPTTPRARAAPRWPASRNSADTWWLLRATLRHHRLPHPAHQADQRGAGRRLPGVAVGVLRRHHHQAAAGAGVRRPDLHGIGEHRPRGPEHRRGRRHRDESHHPAGL